MTTTAKALAHTYNQLTGKSLSPNSYSKAKWAEMIAAAEGPLPAPAEDREPTALAAPTEFFTMPQAARAAGVSPKAARARYRRYDNDHQRTRYEFPASRWDEVIAIIKGRH